MHFLLPARRLSCLTIFKCLTICENKIFVCFYKIEKIKTLFFPANSAEDPLRGHVCPPPLPIRLLRQWFPAYWNFSRTIELGEGKV